MLRSSCTSVRNSSSHRAMQLLMKGQLYELSVLSPSARTAMPVWGGFCSRFLHQTGGTKAPSCLLRRMEVTHTTTAAPGHTAEASAVAADNADEQAPGDVQSSVSVKAADPTSREEVTVARTGGPLATSIRLCSGTVPAADMPCRTVCFTKAAAASDQTADGLSGPAGVQCCVLPEGPTLGSLQQARFLERHALLSPGQLRRGVLG